MSRSFKRMSPLLERVPRSSAPLFALLLAAAVPFAGCSSSDGDGGGTTEPKKAAPWLADGDYFVGIELVEFSGVKLRMKATVTSGGETGKASKISQIELRGLPVLASSDWKQADPMGTLTDVDVDKDGKFVANFGELLVPGQSLPTATDSKVTLILEGTIGADATFCGLVKGEVPAFKQKLEKSTFKAVKYGTEKAEGFETNCDGSKAKTYTHIDACPQVLVGPNKLTSAEALRDFDVYMPAGVTGTGALPVVFLFHGVGGDPAKFIKETKFDKVLKEHAFILVVPQSLRDGTGVPTQKLDWFFTADTYDADNRDLVFFDDMLKCVGETWKIDDKRVYVTGMSGGGLISTFVAAHRSKVVAAAAPFSGGYLHPKWPETAHKTPFMVSWGGAADEAYAQNFHKLATTLIGYLKGTKHPLVQCDHGQKHEWPNTASEDSWNFLSQHTLGGGETADISMLPTYCN